MDCDCTPCRRIRSEIQDTARRMNQQYTKTGSVSQELKDYLANRKQLLKEAHK